MTEAPYTKRIQLPGRCQTGARSREAKQRRGQARWLDPATKPLPPVVRENCDTVAEKLHGVQNRDVRLCFHEGYVLEFVRE